MWIKPESSMHAPQHMRCIAGQRQNLCATRICMQAHATLQEERQSCAQVLQMRDERQAQLLLGCSCRAIPTCRDPMS